MAFMHGDEHVVDRRLLGLVPYRHYGIELPDGTMCENSPPGVRITTYAGFARGRPTRVVSQDLTAAERDLVVERAVSRVGERRYSLTANNCEHFVSWCATGIAISQQVTDGLRAFFDLVRTALAAVALLYIARLAFAE